jgi:hypothetical protein
VPLPNAASHLMEKESASANGRGTRSRDKCSNRHSFSPVDVLRPLLHAVGAQAPAPRLLAPCFPRGLHVEANKSQL